MDKNDYLAALKTDSDAMIKALSLGLDALVPSCPDWNTGQLAGHVLAVYAAWTERVKKGANASWDEFDPVGAFAPYPGFLEWGQDLPRESVPEQVLEWLVQARDGLLNVLRATAPDDPVSTWFPPDQTAGFVQRRMAQETAVHRWDAQAAHGVQEPIEGGLARDGIDEMLDVRLPAVREWSGAPAGNGETFHFHRTDGPGEWLVEFDPDGKVNVSREHAKANAAIRATASDLDLWLWGRIPDDQLDVAGEASLLPRWYELVPSD